MRRRVPDPDAVGYPPKLGVFDVNDWWVNDPDDPAEAGYAKVRWHVARKVYEEGGDWESHLEPPAWWQG